MINDLSNNDPAVQRNQKDHSRKYGIVGTVYIRGLAFKAQAGGRRQQVLLQLKKRDEKDTDWFWLLCVSVFVGGFFTGILAAWYL